MSALHLIVHRACDRHPIGQTAAHLSPEHSTARAFAGSGGASPQSCHCLVDRAAGLEKVVAALLKVNDPEIRWVLDQLQHIRPNRGLSWVGEFWSNDELHSHVATKMPDMSEDQCSRSLMMMKHFPMDFRDGFRDSLEVSEGKKEAILNKLNQHPSEDENSTGGALDDSRDEEGDGSWEQSPPPSPTPPSPPRKTKEPERKRQKKDKFRMAPEYAPKSKTSALFNRESLKGIPEGVRKQLGRWTFAK